MLRWQDINDWTVMKDVISVNHLNRFRSHFSEMERLTNQNRVQNYKYKIIRNNCRKQKLLIKSSILI